MIIAEINMKGVSHEKINTFLLTALREATRDRIVLYGEREHLALLKKNLSDIQDVLFKIVPVFRSGGWVGKLMKPIVESIILFMFCINLWFFHKDKRLFLLSASPVVHYVASRVAKLFSQIDIYVVCHGELEYLLDRKNNISSPGYWVRLSFSKRFQGYLYRIVLGDGILRRLSGFVDVNDAKILTIEHPVDCGTLRLMQNSSADNEFVFGLCGVLTKQSLIIPLSELLNKVTENSENLKGRAKIKLVGSASPEIFSILERHKGSSVLDFTSVTSEMIKTDAYNQAISTFDYFVFIYPSDSYILTASGVVSEALSMHKPIISLDCPYLIDVIAMYGPIGYIEASIECIVSRILDIVDGNQISEGIGYLPDAQNLLSPRSQKSIFLSKLAAAKSVRIM